MSLITLTISWDPPFAICFQELPVAINVPARSELDASGELLPCGSDEPQPSGSGQI